MASAFAKQSVADTVRRRSSCAELALVVMVCVVTAAEAGAGETIRIGGMTFVARESAGRHLVVEAVRAEVDPATELAKLEDVVVRVSGPATDGELTLRCETARVSLGGESFRLDGDVRGVDAAGRRFRTDWLELDGERGVLRTEAAVTVIDGASEYSGAALVYDLEERRLRLLGGARIVRGAVP